MGFYPCLAPAFSGLNYLLLFSQYLLSNYWVPSPVLGAGDKIESFPSSTNHTYGCIRATVE